MKFRMLQRRAMQIMRGPARNRNMPKTAALRHASDASYWLTRAFYLFCIFIAFETLQTLDHLSRSGRELIPLWPVFWANKFGLAASAETLAYALVASSIASVAFPASRLPRIAFCIIFLMSVALLNSFGSLSHADYYPLWISFFMIFAPTRKLAVGAGPTAHYFYTLPFFTTQLFIGFFYTLSGIYKAGGGLFPAQGYVSSFSPEALPYLIMGRWVESAKPPMLEDFFANNIWLAWPTYLVVIYIELTFIIAVFRPQLHRLFGIAMATFHIGVYLTMGIIFTYQSALVCLLFACSPFAPQRFSLKQAITQLPGLGLILKGIQMVFASHRSKTSDTTGA